jgi:hypothetical protein
MNSAATGILLGKIRWKAYEALTSVFDRLCWHLHIPAAPGLKNNTPALKRIVFIGELLPPRTARMAKWVSRSGTYSCLLVCSRRGYVSKFSNTDFEATFLYRNAWHMKRILRSIPRIHLLHSFAPKSYYPDLARLSLNKPFIHDMQDVYATYYGLNPSLRWLQHELPHEKACLELADGVIGHSLEPNVAYRKYKVTKKPSVLFFPLYCDDDQFCLPVRNFKAGEVHLVYAGGVAGSHRNPKQYGNIQFANLIGTLSAQKLHLHIYPSPSNVKGDYEEYETLAESNPYFHFHVPVAQQDLAKELSQYHFGLLPFFRGLSEQSDDKLKYATTLKLFNYLEAGIPLIVSRDLGYQSWLVERYACGMSIVAEDVKTLAAQIALQDYTQLETASLKAREALSLKRNTPRLIRFYEKVSVAAALKGKH